MTEPKDWWDYPEVEAWLTRCREVLAPMVDKSAIGMAIIGSKPDPKIAVELGYSILLDKPIVLVVPEGVAIPDHLNRVADYIIPLTPNDPEFTNAVTTALEYLAERGFMAGGTERTP